MKPLHAPEAASLQAAPAAPGVTSVPMPAKPRHEPAAHCADAGRVVVLVLADFAPAHRLWGWSRLVLQGWPLRRVPGLVFSKVLGSGHGGGFGLRPSGSRQGLFLGFDHDAAACRFVQASPLLQAYRQRSRECCVAVLQATSCKGSWSGAALKVGAPGAPGGPVASLTRASIKPSRLAAFWRMQPAAERALQQAPGCDLAVGLGEAPFLRQCTFSLWRDAAALDAYARSGAHLQAIQAAYAGHHFAESMFVRFEPLSVQGCWKGQAFAYAG